MQCTGVSCLSDHEEARPRPQPGLAPETFAPREEGTQIGAGQQLLVDHQEPQRRTAISSYPYQPTHGTLARYQLTVPEEAIPVCEELSLLWDRQSLDRPTPIFASTGVGAAPPRYPPRTESSLVVSASQPLAHPPPPQTRIATTSCRSH